MIRKLGLWATPLDPEYELISDEEDDTRAVVHPAPADVAAFLAAAFPHLDTLRVVLPFDPVGLSANGRGGAGGWREVVDTLGAQLDPSGERRCVSRSARQECVGLISLRPAVAGGSSSDPGIIAPYHRKTPRRVSNPYR